MKTRILKGHLQYIRSALHGSNELIKKVISIQMERKRNKWAKVTGAYLSALNLKMYDIKVKKNVK